MSRFKMRATVAAAVTGYALASLPSAQAVPVPGGTLDPLTIPKYVTPLVIPPVLHDDGGAAAWGHRRRVAQQAQAGVGLTRQQGAVQIQT